MAVQISPITGEVQKSTKVHFVVHSLQLGHTRFGHSKQNEYLMRHDPKTMTSKVTLVPQHHLFVLTVKAITLTASIGHSYSAVCLPRQLQFHAIPHFRV